MMKLTSIMLLATGLFGLVHEALPQTVAKRVKPYFFSVIVQDMDYSSKWYASNLGYTVVSDSDLPQRGIRIVNLRNEHSLLELIEIQHAIHPDSLLETHVPGARLTGIFKFGLEVTPFEDWIGSLTKAGVQFHGKVVNDPVSGRRMVIILDPDGNRIQLFEQD